jgi:hypothetical protein
VVQFSTDPTAVSTALVIGKPRRTESNMVEVESFLTPLPERGMAANVVSQEITGTFRIDRVQHSGSNRSGRFTTLTTLADTGGLA